MGTWSGLLPLVVTSALFVTVDGATNWGDLSLPLEHVPYFFRNNPYMKQRCRDEDSCPYKSSLEIRRCWGYEDGCPVGERMSTPLCTDDESQNLSFLYILMPTFLASCTSWMHTFLASLYILMPTSLASVYPDAYIPRFLYILMLTFLPSCTS
ncbi:uncharacterized protein LOC124264434 [Haliotis rubra]|uniref:uncharacterized protein LOC124264434 n=1 Tax=Haliotis rubra TaxID=36100 RepID=UPI001EE5138F|nr:uncharacterized protein LOC124264434 [Haliotis rubra]